MITTKNGNSVTHYCLSISTMDMHLRVSMALFVMVLKHLISISSWRS